MRKINYSEPQIYPLNPTRKDMAVMWRVRFDYYHDDKRYQICRRGMMNAEKVYSKRLQLARDLKTLLLLRLRKGWNPVTNEYPAKTVQEIELENLQNSTFEEALQFAYNKKLPGWKHKTSQDFKSAKKYMVDACHHIGIYKAIKDFRRVDFKLILEQTAVRRKLSPIGYNRYREYLSSLVAELVEWDIMESNVIRDIKTKDVARTVAHRPPTQDQRVLIVEKVKNENRDYYRFLCVLYGCGIRPKEITGLRIKHLHKMEGLFRLPPEITKSSIERDAAVPVWLMDLLTEMNLHKYDPECFIFSGRGNMFRPGKVQMSVNVSTSYWRKIVKKGLGLDVNQYSLKKLSGDDLVKLQRREGATRLLGLAQLQFGHESEGMTSVYTQQDKTEMLNIIREKMPVL